MIVGGRESETLPASPGDVRAYDVRSGKLRGRFIRFRIRASSDTTPGPKTRGRRAALPPTGLG